MTDETTISPMTATQPWYTSKTIWASGLAIFAPVASLVLHVSVSDTQIQTAAACLAAVGGGVGGLIAIYGRIKATKVIAPNPKP